ncbi:MAG TPA: hypothetical protein PKD85_04255 [Saprospiraceae bacterium]|nr:hypothetical protein [Saprospiraceae bacterium]
MDSSACSSTLNINPFILSINGSIIKTKNSLTGTVNIFNMKNCTHITVSEDGTISLIFKNRNIDMTFKCADEKREILLALFEKAMSSQ